MMNYIFHSYSIEADHKDYGYPRGGFDIPLNRSQLNTLIKAVLPGKTKKQVNRLLPLHLDPKDIKTVSALFSFSPLLSLKNMDYGLCGWGVTGEYFDSITMLISGQHYLCGIAAYSRSTKEFSYANHISIHTKQKLNFSTTDFISKRKLDSMEVAALCREKEGQVKYKYNRRSFEYYLEAVPCEEYLFPVSK